MTIKETVLDIIDTVRNRNDACQYTAGLIEGFVKLIDDESSPVSDGWIPVSERLPDNSEYVIALQSYSDSILVSYYSGGKWHSDSEYQIAGITHWQPLPKPPTK